MNGANRRHWNTNLRIMPSKDGASASVFLMLVDVSTKPRQSSPPACTTTRW